jgi:hypothetical protein
VALKIYLDSTYQQQDSGDQLDRINFNFKNTGISFGFSHTKQLLLMCWRLFFEVLYIVHFIVYFYTPTNAPYLIQYNHKI